jgi:hypothetical protein
MSGQINRSVKALGSVAATAVVVADPSSFQITTATLTASGAVPAFPAPGGPGANFLLVLTQDGTGSRVPTWPAGTKWAAATAPTLSTGAGKVDALAFESFDGTTWAGRVLALDVR